MRISGLEYRVDPVVWRSTRTVLSSVSGPARVTEQSLGAPTLAWRMVVPAVVPEPTISEEDEPCARAAALFDASYPLAKSLQT